MNKKGSLLGFLDNMQFIFVLIIVLVGAVALIYGLAVAGPPIVGESTNAINMFKSSMQEGGYNNSEVYNATVTPVNMVSGVLGKFELLVYAIFLGGFIGFLIVAYEVKFYPYLAFVWVGLMVIAVLFSMVISNAYQEQALSGPTAEYYSNWGNSGWLMEYLPHILTGLGFISGILLFILRTRAPEEELNSGSVNL